MDEAEREKFAAFLLRMRAAGFTDRGLIAAFEATPRTSFVPAQWRADAWSDRMVPIECGEAIEGIDLQMRALAALDLQPGCRVLEIGTGSGYQTAVLAQLVERVFSFERFQELQERAKERLGELKLRNVVFRWGDGWEGWSALAPYNGIIVTAAAADVPQALLDQLAPGGRLVIPVGVGEVQQLMLIVREEGGFSRHLLDTVRFVPLLNGPVV